MLRDFFFVCSSSRALRALTAQGSPTYLYQFTYLPDWIEIPKMGVYHSVELEFVWDNAWSDPQTHPQTHTTRTPLMHHLCMRGFS